MSRACPKCQYIRSPEDTAPDWQCPSCGIAYAKYLNSNHAAAVQSPGSSGKTGSRGLVPLVVLFLVLASFVGMALAYSSSDSTSNRIALANGEARVILYGTQRCGYCRRVRNWFNREGIPYLDKDVEHSRQAWQEFRELGGRGVPVLVIGGNVIHGYNRRKIAQALRNAGLN